MRKVGLKWIVEKVAIRMVLILYLLLFHGCVEPFEAQTLTFESALVVDASITNEIKQQEIQLSRTFAFEADGPQPERNASVNVLDDQGSSLLFVEESPGIYHSETAFGALSGRTYQLLITTSNGRTYKSEPSRLTPAATMDKLFAERTTNSDEVEGMAIRVNSSSSSGKARNYRYEYEETYKIVAPQWTPKQLVPDPGTLCDMLVVPREKDEQTCYATDASNSIILTDTNSLPTDQVQDFTVRFINRKNYIITYRYSILVRQYVQSSTAYTFFETLKDFSGTGSLFSQIQPGFLEGNVYSVENPEEKVLGYFDVASVTEKRIFFDYTDFFPGEPLPPYVIPCSVSAPPLTAGLPPHCVLRSIVAANTVRYLNDNGQPGLGEGPYLVVPRACGDCTALGKTAVPAFWTDNNK